MAANLLVLYHTDIILKLFTIYRPPPTFFIWNLETVGATVSPSSTGCVKAIMVSPWNGSEPSEPSGMWNQEWEGPQAATS